MTKKDIHLNRDYYRVEWQSKTNPSFNGHGDWSEDMATIDAWISEMNQKYPDLDHTRGFCRTSEYELKRLK